MFNILSPNVTGTWDLISTLFFTIHDSISQGHAIIRSLIRFVFY